ncbi:unnamed protein product [Rhizophagus irregularis]|nr:unnamed protein product [Rhizophagus irregularis]
MANEWINWIEEAIVKEHLKYYEYNQFNDIQQIGSGGFGKVYRAKWKNFEHLALKSFINPESNTVKEIVREIKLQRDADYSNNIIRFHGISKFKSENRMNYMLVIEYADGACGVSCLHNEGIVHNDLHSGQRPFYVEDEEYDIGLALEISQGFRETPVTGTPEDYVNLYTKCWDGEPDNRPTIYQVVDWLKTNVPDNFESQTNENTNERIDWIEKAIEEEYLQYYDYKKFSDIRQVGTGDEEYDIGLALEISQGFRETPVTGTPEDYVNLYTKCWDGEPDNRPTIYQVVDWLKTNVPDNFESQTNENTNERIDWIEKAIEEEYLQYYDYKQFSDIRQVGTGGFGTVFRANLKNSEQQFALKSFKLNNTSKEEIINELKILLKVDFHNNIIRFFGITKSESAYQLARGVSCLHSKEIVHCDLHSGNVLVHQKGIKLADFGLSKKIGTLSNLQGERYDIGLIREISQGLRETVVPGTPENYENIYTKCWDGEPENRPTINQVVDWLKAIITKTNEGLQSSNKQDDVTAPQSTNDESELHISTYKNFT